MITKIILPLCGCQMPTKKITGTHFSKTTLMISNRSTLFTQTMVTCKYPHKRNTFFQPIFIPIDDRVEKVKKSMYGLLQNREIAFFYKSFLSIDLYDSKRISIAQFYDYIEEERTKLGDALFQLIDIDIGQTNSLSFGEFLHTIVTLCLMDVRELYKMIFFTFDTDKNGYLNADEINDMLEVFTSLLWVDKRYDFAIRKHKLNIELPSDSLLDFDELCTLVDSNTALFYASTSMQNKAMIKFKGHQFWKQKKLMIISAQNAKQEKADKDFNRCEIIKMKRQVGLLRYYFQSVRHLLWNIDTANSNNIRSKERVQHEVLENIPRNGPFVSTDNKAKRTISSDNANSNNIRSKERVRHEVLENIPRDGPFVATHNKAKRTISSDNGTFVKNNSHSCRQSRLVSRRTTSSLWTF